MKDNLYDRFKDNFSNSIVGNTLIQWANELSKMSSQAFNVEHPGNFFKLYSLYAYLLFPYLHIMPNQRSRSKSPFKLIYVDLFAGNGLNSIETNGRNYFVCGSSILTIFACYLRSQSRKYDCYFDHMFMIDQKEDSLEILSHRIQYVAKKLGIDSRLRISNNVDDTSSNVVITKGNVTNDNFIQSLTKTIEKIWGGDLIHVMLFVDPDTPGNLKMQTLKKLLQYPGDLILLLHPGIFIEMVMKKRYKEESLIAMLDISASEAKDLLSEKQTQAKLSEYYVKKYQDAIRETPIKRLKGQNRRNVIIKVPIQTRQSSYLLIYATRNTSGDSSGWQKPFEDFATWIGKQSKTGDLALQILTGSQSSIEDFSS